MHVILNGQPLEKVDCFKYLGSQVAADGGCERDMVHRMNEGNTDRSRWNLTEQIMNRVQINLVQHTQCSNMTSMTQQESLIRAKAWPPNTPGAQ